MAQSIPGLHETFSSINEIVTWFGIERRLLIASVVLGFGLFQISGLVIEHNFWFAVLIVLPFLAAARYVTKHDIELPRILIRNMEQKTYYCPFQLERRNK